MSIEQTQIDVENYQIKPYGPNYILVDKVLNLIVLIHINRFING